MPRWTVVDKQETAGSIAMHFVTVGISKDLGMTDYSYTVEDEHGNKKTVIARNKYELGDAIAEGAFQDARLEAPTSSVNANASAGGGGEQSEGGGLLERGISVIAVLMLLAVLSIAFPRAEHAFESIVGLAAMAAVGWIIFRVFKKLSPP